MDVKWDDEDCPSDKSGSDSFDWCPLDVDLLALAWARAKEENTRLPTSITKAAIIAQNENPYQKPKLGLNDGVFLISSMDSI